METETYAALSPNAVANKHWFEIWSIEQDGSLKSCINFYDAALKDAATWVTQCFNQETARTDDPYSIVHAFKLEDGTTARMIVSCTDSKVFAAVNKFKESLNFN